MKSRIVLLLTLATGALLAACAPAPTPTATAVPPTATPAPATDTPAPPTSTPTPAPPTDTPSPTPPPMTISSPVFEPGGEIAERYGFFRENVSPELNWENVPPGSESLALLMEDRDFPFSHWVIYNVPPDASGLPEGVPRQPRLDSGALQGLNSNEEIGYVGPYPPVGDTHRYAFVLYALDMDLSLEPGVGQEEVLAAMEGHILTTAEVVGTYQGISP